MGHRQASPAISRGDDSTATVCIKIFWTQSVMPLDISPVGGLYALNYCYQSERQTGQYEV